MLDKVTTFIRQEAVLCIAFLCAAASAFFVPPSVSYLAYIDVRVLVLLFCLMTAVHGLKDSGLFFLWARKLVEGKRTLRFLIAVLVMLPFFASMLLTNDVALLVFTPFAMLALRMADHTEQLAIVAVLQAVAANLGGMITPLGNPQNLFIYTKFEISIFDFLATLLPFALLAFALLLGSCLLFSRKPMVITVPFREQHVQKRTVVVYSALFGLSLLTVLRVMPYEVLLIVVIITLLVFDRKAFARVDYALLATFVCFFIFSGNMAQMTPVQGLLGGAMDAHPLLTSVAASQIISNVPAAVLLSEFTMNWHSLLLGVDLGGLGTPIASLASLIAFRLYMHTEEASAQAFFRWFAVANVVGLAAMLGLYALLFVG